MLAAFERQRQKLDGIDASARADSLVERLRQAELVILEKEQRIRELEARNRFLEEERCIIMTGHADDHEFESDRREGGTTMNAAAESVDDCYASAADLERVCDKSEELVRAMAALDCGEEVKQQWAALMSSNEDYKDRLRRIESMAAMRMKSLPSGDTELRLCRAVRGLCVGAERRNGRRWSLIA